MRLKVRFEWPKFLVHRRTGLDPPVLIKANRNRNGGSRPALRGAGVDRDSPAYSDNDIAIVWPPSRKPILVTAYYMNHTTDPIGRKAVLAEVGRIVAGRA